jgi:hypothetical protein
MTNFIDNTIGINSSVSSNAARVNTQQNMPKSNNRSKPQAMNVENAVEADNNAKSSQSEAIESIPTKSLTADEIRKINEEYLAKKASEEGAVELTKAEKKAKKEAERLKKKKERKEKKNNN